MAKQTSDHGITLDEKAQEQPTDKDRAQTAATTETSHGASRATRKEDSDDELQPLREKSGF
jgi:hypothetical protein